MSDNTIDSQTAMTTDTQQPSFPYNAAADIEVAEAQAMDQGSDGELDDLQDTPPPSPSPSPNDLKLGELSISRKEEKARGKKRALESPGPRSNGGPQKRLLLHLGSLPAGPLQRSSRRQMPQAMGLLDEDPFALPATTAPSGPSPAANPMPSAPPQIHGPPPTSEAMAYPSAGTPHAQHVPVVHTMDTATSTFPSGQVGMVVGSVNGQHQYVSFC